MNMEFDPGYAKQRRMLFVCYLLLGLSWFGFLPAIGAVILLYLMGNEVRFYPDLARHRQYAIYTFWVFLAATVISIPLMIVLIGYVTGLIALIWFYYRVIKGAYALHNNSPL